MARKSTETVKRELLEEAEELVAELLEWERAHPESEFATLEKLVLELRQRFGQRVAEALLEIQKQREPVAAPGCPECGHPTQHKGGQRLTFESLLGPLTVERSYYYCPECGHGYCPLDRQLALPAPHWSPGVVREVLWLNGHTLTYGESAAILSQLTAASISKSSAWRLVQTWGKQLGAESAAEEAAIKAQYNFRFPE